MDTQLIQQLARIMKRSDLTELEIDDQAGNLRVHMKRGAEAGGGSPLVNVMQGGGMVPGPAPEAGQPHPEVPSAPAASKDAELPPGTIPFKSPMVGTFYRASSPDSEPFADVGSRVGPETTVCILEAMKVMNEIKAETSGVIVEFLVENAEPVEFGQPLFLIRKG